MSSGEESAPPTLKKRKLQRACDYCRRKKIKCDGSKMPNNRCSKCTARDVECTYLMGQSKTYSKSYVEGLESRLERMERLLMKDKDKSKVLDDRQLYKHRTSERPPAGGSRVGPLLNPSGFSVVLPAPGPADDLNVTEDNDPHSDSEEGQELDQSELVEDMQRLSMDSPPLRYHGKSSGLVFIRSAMALKNEYVGAPPPPKRDGQHPWLKAFVEDDFPLIDPRTFPPPDLLSTLVALYFTHINCYCPLLHAPTFTTALAAGEHLRNGGFGATVLLVCAIGARFARDPRVLLDGSEDHHSAGWRWFLPVERVRRMSFAPAKIYYLQTCALMALFLQGTSATWSVIGAGIRIALDVGAHRKTMYSPTPTVEDELWRRAFWILVLMEWMTSYGMGRPSSIHEEDFDLALPTECDDEYWLSPQGEPTFKQPPDKPSNVTAFVCVLKLGQILAFAMRTIYSTNKACSAQLGQSHQQWEQRIVADLDSALNKWSDALPPHLRWDPSQQDVGWLTQAASLRAAHYYVQFAVHRPFISASRRASPLSLPSVIICTNGARSAIEVLEVLAERTGSPGHRNMGILFIGGAVLMMNILGLRRAGRVVNSGNLKDLEIVGKAVEMLRSLRYELHVAETLGDILHELLSAVTSKEPLPPGGHIPEGRQEGASNTTEANQAHDTEAGVSTSCASAPYIPPGVDFLKPDAFNFTLPEGLGSLGYPAASPQVFAGPTGTGGISMQRDSPFDVPPLSLLPHTYGFLPRLDSDPSQPQLWSAEQRQGPRGGPHQFDMAGGQMFGLEPLGYNQSMSFLPPASQLEVETRADYAQQQDPLEFANAAGMESGLELGGNIDAGVPDFALMDDELVAWLNVPPAMGWEEWGAYFENMNNAGT